MTSTLTFVFMLTIAQTSFAASLTHSLTTAPFVAFLSALALPFATASILF